MIWWERDETQVQRKGAEMTIQEIRRKLRLMIQEQLDQYPEKGPPGISYFKGEIDHGCWVDCLLWRDEHGKLRGVLNRFPMHIPPERVGRFMIAGERKGNIFILVDPDWQRRGIATALLDQARSRWKIKFEQQEYTPDGAAFIAYYLKSRGLSLKHPVNF
jgi:GNAT superfamily N-acetyltransferase